MPTPRPRLLLTTARALAIVTACYASTAWAAAVLFRFVEHVRGSADARGEQATAIFGVIMAACWLCSVASIARSRR